jgi:GDP-mannose 6-dehydrogenase
MVLASGKKKIAVLGLSFKAATDDLRESPQVQLVKHLIGEGCEVAVWDDNVSLGRLVGSNRRYIEEVIPHIGGLLKPNLSDALLSAEVVILATRGIDRATLDAALRPEQIVVDLVNLEKSRRPSGSNSYEGICW